jgi:hypothetical protein
VGPTDEKNPGHEEDVNPTLFDQTWEKDLKPDKKISRRGW